MFVSMSCLWCPVGKLAGGLSSFKPYSFAKSLPFPYVPPHVGIPSGELKLVLPATFTLGFLIHVLGSWLASF